MNTRILAALALASVASSSHAITPWTSFKVGKLNSAATYSTNSFVVRSDGRFLYSEAHDLYSQNTFGLATKTKINRGTLVFDPSFIAVRDLTHGLMGVGGFGASGVHTFNPAAPATAISSTALGTLQNYAAVWWQHPTSGRSGWIIAGGNGTGGKSNLSFLSADGIKTGALTDVLSDYSAGIATDATGNMFVALSEDFATPLAPDSETVLKYTAAQIDTAVAAIIAGTPAPLAKSAATTVFKFDSAATIAVDGFGRIWAAGYLSNDLQVFDPVLNKDYHIVPTHAALAGAAGAPTYQVATFTRSGLHYVAFLANDSFFTKNSDVVYGTALAEDLPVHQVSFATAGQTVSESAGIANITIMMTPPLLKAVTIPITISGGTATPSVDASLVATKITFQPNQIAGQISVTIINDGIDEPDNNETFILKLDTSSPATHAVSGGGTHTITITDDDVRPLFDPVQAFGTGRVGSQYSYQMAMVSLIGPLPVTYKATGLPTGMSIDKNSGVISGRATVPGEYDSVVITATNSAGVSVSRGYSIVVDGYVATAHGAFTGVIAPSAESNGLGGRIDFNTTATATFTGKAVLGKVTYPISGLLDTSTANPSGTASFKIGANNVVINFSIDASTGAMSGTLGAATFTGWHCQTSSALVGAHNFSLKLGSPSTATPEGTGFGTATVLTTALTSISGRAGDGSVFTSGALLGVGGELPVFQVLYANPGALRGSISIASDAAHTVAGALDWTKPVQTTQPYINGWIGALAVTANGGKYRPVSGSTAVLGMVEGSGYDAALTFSDGGIATLTVNAIIRPAVLVTIAAPTTLVITNTTGAVSGKFVSGATTLFYGLLVPDATTADPFDAKGAGYFVAGSRSGAVALSPIP